MKNSLFNKTCDRRKRSIALHTILYSITLLTSQYLWLFTLPAKADKIDGGGTAICGVPGQDGSPTVSTGQVNTYFPGTASAASAGSNSITVGTASGTPGINPGDLLLIIQMQGAEIDTTNTNAYGDNSAVNNPNQGAANYPAGGVVNGNLASNFTAGNFEYAVATNSVGTGGGTINLSSPLVNNYSNADFGAQGQKRFQVIRVPQYANLTVSGTITTAPWDGTKGGIVAIDVAGKLTFSGGQINVNGLGFRGGGGRQLGGGTGANTDVRTLSTNNANGSKGEGTAGTPRYLFNPSNNTLINNTAEGYPNGSYGRGAPGNAGGGGTDGNPGSNDQNAGGGGGSNGGLGGKGGRTWSSALPYGGDGGAPFPASASRLVLGGGGGAGSTNNGTGTPGNGLASSGAPGGGIVLLRTGSITGTGTISANGASPAPIPANDASGGGGGGGSVLVISQNANIPAGITINANGGKGGTNTGGGSPHGPGGGGAGGVVYLNPGGAATINLNGGQPGTTNNNATNFGGATAGDGVFGPVSTTATDTVTSISGSNCLINVAKTTSTPGPLTAPTTATYTITASNPSGTKRATANQVVISDDNLPTGFTHTAGAITPVYSGGASGPATVTSTGTTSKPTWSGFTIPPGGSVALTFTVNIASGTAPAKYDNSATATGKYTNSSANVTTVSGTTGTVDSNYNGTVTTNTGDDVTIVPPSSLTADKTVLLVVDSDKSGGTTPLASQVPTPGDIIEYTVVVKNTSTTTQRDNVVLADNIPANTTYITSSLQISAGANSGAKTDTTGDDQANFTASQVAFRLGTGANETTGGTLAANATSTIKFRVKVNDPLPNGITTVSNQAVVSSNGVGNTNSNDPNTPTLLDPTISKIAPRLRLVKRVTGVKKASSAIVTTIALYNDLATDVNDDASVSWTPNANTYLLGAIASNQIPTPNPGIPAPQDEVEYTIYFLVDGGIPAKEVDICDFIPANQTYVAGTMQLNLNGTTSAIADTPGSTGGFYTGSFPAGCSGTNNSRGAADFKVGNVDSNSYGYVRFRAKVN